MYHCQKNELVRSLFRPVKITAGFKRLVFLCDAKVSAIKCLCDSFHQICLSVCQSTALLFVSFSVTFGGDMQAVPGSLWFLHQLRIRVGG